jgi:quinoprotein glucose dehydrogenase
MYRRHLIQLVFLIVVCLAQLHAGEWRSYGGNPANWKYSSLSQISEKNVSRLKIAWKWIPPDEGIHRRFPALQTWKYELTPIVVGESLYVSTPLNQIAALDSTTGQTLWTYDPRAYSGGMPVNFGFLQRGLAYWADGKESRIISGTADGYLVALNAKTGQPVDSFGRRGRVDLTEGLDRPVSRSLYGVNSPPIICKNVIVVGSTIMDSPVTNPMPPGDVRGFDVQSGKLLWTFHTIPRRGEYGSETWLSDPSAFGAANVWAPLAADESLGYVYLPVSSPSGDFYRGGRPGDGLFGDTLLCLDARTGKRIWHFQLLHHDLWDRDPPAAPILTNGAVVQVTKQGFIYVFDPATGRPLWPIVEQAVPQSRVLGEHSAATQPIPTRPDPFELQGLSVEDLINFTPALNREARRLLTQFDFGPLFAPPSEKGSILSPGLRGGASWAGAAYDPETDDLYVPSITAPSLIQLYADRWIQWPTPSFKALQRGYVTLPNGLPVTKPPYGRVTAINFKSGNVVWMKPMGNGPIHHPDVRELHLKRLGWPYRGFPVVTKTLLFIAQEGDLLKTLYRANGQDAIFSNVEPSIQIFDKASGTLLTEIPLPANASGSPMTYMAKQKQYVLVAVGGGNIPAELVALALR